MLKALEETALRNKISLATIGAGYTNTAAGAASWITENILLITSFGSFFLTVTMIVVHFAKEYRENRSHKVDIVKKELEIEKLREEVADMKRRKVSPIKPAPNLEVVDTNGFPQ